MIHLSKNVEKTETKILRSIDNPSLKINKGSNKDQFVFDQSIGIILNLDNRLENKFDSLLSLSIT